MPDQEKDPIDREHSPVDIHSILLPKKDPSPASAQRVNAGALLEQEQNAELLKPAAPEAPAAPTEPKKEDSIVKPIQTYQADIESLVEKKDISVVSIAAAEADRKKTPEPAVAAPARRGTFARAALIVGGVAIVAAGIGTVAYVFLMDHSVPFVPTNETSPFITVDKTAMVSLEGRLQRSSVMQMLNDARESAQLSLGLVERLFVAVPSTDTDGNATQKEVPLADMLTILAPHAPQAFIRTLEPIYLLGVHSFDENQAFLIMRVDAYETAYAGLLQWESTLYTDLQPLFARTPPVRPANEATSSAPLPTSVLATGFVDRIVENRDVRAKENTQGDILLLWTFLNRNTVLITTNEFTLREVISRMTEAPVQYIPGQ